MEKSVFCCKFVAQYNKMKRLILTAVILSLHLPVLQAQQPFIIVIDPGHGGKDPGSVGTIVQEKKINLSVALLLGGMIEQNHENIKVVYTRKTDVFIPLDERANIANRQKADLFISIHTNSVRKVNVTGTETYTLGLGSSEESLEVAMRENAVILEEDDYLQKYEGFDPNSTESYIIFEFMNNKHLEQSISLASEIQKAFVNLQRGNRGVRQAGFLVLRKTGMPSVLIELGYLSNRIEEKFLASKEGQYDLAESIYQAVTRYKNDYDRKLGNMSGRTIETVNVRPVTPETNTSSSSSSSDDGAEQQDKVIYKVQILTSDRKLSVKDKRFKGYDGISFYEEKGVYKYTYGATDDYSKVMSMYRKAAKDFKGAFIIKTKNGKRMYQ